MTSAAVGFQCPECVKSGRKETRAGLARYGGKHASNPMTTSIVLIVINVIVWLAIMATGLNGSTKKMEVENQQFWNYYYDFMNRKKEKFYVMVKNLNFPVLF